MTKSKTSNIHKDDIKPKYITKFNRVLYKNDPDDLNGIILDNGSKVHLYPSSPNRDKENKPSKNKKVLNEFIKFCKENPDFRFWQALYAWCGAVGQNGILIKGKDPFYWEGKYE